MKYIEEYKVELLGSISFVENQIINSNKPILNPFNISADILQAIKKIEDLKTIKKLMYPIESENSMTFMDGSRKDVWMKMGFVQVHFIDL